ncbi:MAG: hypothetical protein AB7O26_05745 [Planctomycetaceae bacterium]
MSEFHGDLLIGGARLKSLHGELEEEHPFSPLQKSREWLLEGQLHLKPDEWETIGPNRQYRLELDDGRAAQVMITRIVSQSNDEIVVNFEPCDWHTQSTVRPPAK